MNENISEGQKWHNICHECRVPRFGHTCNKEISGIIHILSFISNFELKNDTEISIKLQML